MNRLIETYLLHVKSHLPASLRDDVAAEIEDGLRQKIEAQEEQTGQAVTDDEISRILTEWGHPVQVAGQYLPRQYLIGPSTYPAYWHALRALVVVFGAIFAFRLILIAATGNFGGIPRSVGSTLWGLMAWAAILTAIFAAMEARGVSFFRQFDARKLPSQHLPSRRGPTQPITRFESAFGFIFLFAILIWWFDAFGFALLPRDFGGGQLPMLGYELQVGATADRFFYPVLFTLLGGLALWGRCFVRPYWTRPAMAGRLVLTLAEIAVLAALLRTPDVFTLAVADGAANAEGLGALVPVILASLRVLAVILIIAKAFSVLGDAIRLLRNRA